MTGGLQALEELGVGRPQRGIRAIAVNHDPLALLTHRANHPEVEHYDCDIETLNPDDVLHGERINLLWFSAPCQPYSDAANPHRKRKDGKPIALPYTRPQQRATPAYAVDWIRKGQPDIIIEENVPGIIKKWRDWPQHLKDIEGLGYDIVVTPRSNAADYGVPQDRRRMILVAVKKGYPLALPVPSHSNPKKLKPGTKPWLGAETVIDRSLYCPPIFGRRTKRGKPRDLKPTVRNRIGRYLDELGPFWHLLAEATRGNTGPVRLLDALEAVPQEQWPSIVRLDGDTLHIQPHEPWLVKFYNNARNGQSLAEPLPTLTTGGNKAGSHIAVVQPEVSLTQDFILGQHGGATARTTKLPGPTIPTACFVRLGEFGFILPKRGPMGGHESNPGRPKTAPLNAQVAGRDSSHVVDVGIAVDDGVILPHNGEDKGQKPRFHSVKKGFPTICASRAKNIAFVYLYAYHGKTTAGLGQGVVKARIEDCYLTVGMRPLTIREQALGQGCPPSYKFPCKTKRATQNQVGNMVPPPMAKAYVHAATKPILPLLARRPARAL